MGSRARAPRAAPPPPTRVDLARDLVLRLEPRLPRLAVGLAPSAPPQTRVSRDGVELGAGALGVPLAIDPGAHTIEVTLEGVRARAYQVVIAEQETKRLVVEPALAPPQTAPIRPPSTRLPGWVLVGAGGVALGVGVTFGVLTVDRAATMRDHCDARAICDRVGYDASHEGRVFDLVSTVSFIATGALLAAGVGWLTLR